MGVVYEATQVSLNRTIALKLLAPHLSEDPIFHERFRREGVLQAALDHPNIVAVHEAGESDFGLFLAMQLVRGPRLKDLILARELDARRSVNLLEPIADALDTAHALGLVHRDVKPQNILVGAREHPFLADFGLTKLAGGHSLTDSGHVVGTLDYIAPEQIVGERPTPQTDVYALGAVLYECLTGVVPFPGETQAAVLWGHMNEPAPRVSQRQPQLPQALDDSIRRALSKDPAERFVSASELIEAAREGFGGDIPAIAPVPRPSGDSTPRVGDLDRVARRRAAEVDQGETPTAPDRPRRRRMVVAGVALLLAAIGAGVAAGASGGTRVAASGSRAGSLELTWPAGWRRTSDQGPIKGFDFIQPVVLIAPGGGGRDGIVAGQVQTAGPLLLPQRFLNGLPHSPPRPLRVKLGQIEGVQYGNLAPRRSHRRATVYAIDTNRGIATVVCFASPGSAAKFLPRCSDIAATLRIEGARTSSLAPSSAYASRISDIIGPLALVRSGARARLSHATTPDGQAQAAAELSRAYARATRELSAIRPPGPAERVHVPLTLNAARAEAAYADLASAVANSDARAYRRAAGKVDEAERAVTELVAALGALGYALA